jgi:hypothetical protein
MALMSVSMLVSMSVSMSMYVDVGVDVGVGVGGGGGFVPILRLFRPLISCISTAAPFGPHSCILGVVFAKETERWRRNASEMFIVIILFFLIHFIFNFLQRNFK